MASIYQMYLANIDRPAKMHKAGIPNFRGIRASGTNNAPKVRKGDRRYRKTTKGERDVVEAYSQSASEESCSPKLRSWPSKSKGASVISSLSGGRMTKAEVESAERGVCSSAESNESTEGFRPLVMVD